MSLLRPSSLKVPVKVTRPSGLVQPKCSASAETSKLNSGKPATDVKARSTTPEHSSKSADEVSARTPGSNLYMLSSEIPEDDIRAVWTLSTAPILTVIAKAQTMQFEHGNEIQIYKLILWKEPNSNLVTEFGSQDRSPGVIAFLGETQFAPGEWAGVILEAPIGKNDGSVAGVRYFSCKPLYGIFSKVPNLSHCPASAVADPPARSSIPANSRQRDSLASNDSGIITTLKASSSDELSPAIEKGDCQAKQTAKIIGSSERDSADAESADAAVKPSALARVSPRSIGLMRPPAIIKVGHSGGTAPNIVTAVGNGGVVAEAMPLDSRVVVSGNKAGTLRYIGLTHFAKGEWAGIELDEPQGKNDGSVEGNRYFSCNPMFGLFAPVGKVALAPVLNTPPSVAPSLRRPSSQSTSAAEPLSRLPPVANERINTPTQPPKKAQRLAAEHVSKLTPVTCEKIASQESLNSIGSKASSASRSRVRLGLSSTSAAGSSKITNLKGTTQLGASSASSSATALQKALKEKEEHVQQLLVERDLERSEMARMASNLDEVEAQLSVARIRYDTYVAESEDKLQLMLQTVEQLGLENSNLCARLEEEKRRVDDLQFAVEEASADGLQAATICSAATSDQEVIINEQNAEIERLSFEITTNEKQLAAISFERDEFRVETERLKLELSDKASEMTTLTTSTIANSSIITQLNIQLNALQQKLDESNQMVLEYEDRLDDLKQQLQESVDHANSMEDMKSRLERQLSELVNNSGDSSQQLLHLDNELSSRDSTILRLEHAINELVSNVETLTAELEGERLRAAEAEAKVNRLSSERDVQAGQLGEKEAELDETLRDFAVQIAKLNEEKSSLETKIHFLLVEQNKSDEEKEKRYSAIDKEMLDIKMALTDKADECNMKSNEVLSLQSTIERLNGTIERLNENLNAIELCAADNSLKDDVTLHEFQRLQDENVALVAARNEIEGRLLETLAEIKTEREIRATMEYERKQLADDLSSVIASRDSLKLIESAMSDNINELNVLSLANHHLQAENDTLSQDLAKSNIKATRVDELLTEVAKLKAEILDADMLYQSTVSKIDAEKGSLSQSIMNYEVQLENKDAKLNALLKEIDELKSELGAVKKETSKTSLANLELTDCAEIEGGKTMKNSELESALEEIKFLNAVIVDLQSKNEALQLKLDSILSTEYELDVLNASIDSSEMPRAAGLRLFCDICDVFDQHDTDDCPIQASSGTPPDRSPNYCEVASSFSDRPYCDICEVFGHWSEDCDDQQTF